MSQPMEPVNPYDSPETVRPGMSSGSKALFGVAIGCGALLLLCCGVLGIGGYFFGRSFQRAVSEEPAAIRQVTADIVTIDVPEALEPKMSFDWTIPFVNRKMVTMAVYTDHEEHSVLALFQLGEAMGAGVDAEAMKTQFQQSMRESGEKGWDDVKLDESEKFPTKINGADAEFTVGHGKLEKEDREVWQASGGFSGKGGPAMLVMQLDAKTFTKEQVMAVLQSMK